MSRDVDLAALPVEDRESPVPKRHAAFWYATWFGTGLAPFAPATVATLATLPVHFALVHLPPLVHLAIIVLMTVLGLYAAQRVADDLGEDDPQIVVIDESVAILLALWIGAPHSLVAVVVAVLLFRALDIYKPWPIAPAGDLKPAALGILADDILAGVAAGALTWPLSLVGV
jgi:phosphatidylglycerophosphatase A